MLLAVGLGSLGVFFLLLVALLHERLLVFFRALVLVFVIGLSVALGNGVRRQPEHKSDEQVTKSLFHELTGPRRIAGMVQQWAGSLKRNFRIVTPPPVLSKSKEEIQRICDAMMFRILDFRKNRAEDGTTFPGPISNNS